LRPIENGGDCLHDGRSYDEFHHYGWTGNRSTGDGYLADYGSRRQHRYQPVLADFG
jgi:hypothetical protein